MPRFSNVDSTAAIPSAHTIDIHELTQHWQVSPDHGLSSVEAARRLKKFGKNTLKEIKKPSRIQVLVAQFASPVVFILALAAGFSGLMGEWAEFIAIVVVLVINALIGFVTEWRAIASMDALRNLSTRSVRVRRDDLTVQINATDAVPGDIMLLDAGDVIAADARLVKVSNLRSDESALTGESEPADKSTVSVNADTGIADRHNMVHKGCAISAGSGEALVTGTGMHTELGRISALVESSNDTDSPLENQLSALSRDMIGFTLIVTVLVGISGILAGQPWTLMVQSAIALAVAAIPEGLPVVATLALARGMWRMAKQDALIERLAAVETLGATSIIMTDKTGTLTENNMRVAWVVTEDRSFPVDDNHFSSDCVTSASLDDNPSLTALLRTASLCNSASLGNSSGIEPTGDPMEVSLLYVAESVGMDQLSMISQYPETQKYEFETKTRRMATVHSNGTDKLVAVKGAPEAIFEISRSVSHGADSIPFDEQVRHQWESTCTSLAAQGFRVLALAGKHDTQNQPDPYSELMLFGVVAFRDPPRADIASTVAQIQQAGVSVIMITGDHPSTASFIAREVGITENESGAINGEDLGKRVDWSNDDEQRYRSHTVFSRVSPEQKLDLISLHQAAGHVVAMTGDGINDAPALKKADIGIAMGIRGTQVAKEAADIILRNDAFSTIVKAISEGRIIFTNIRRFALYLLSCNLSEVLVVAIAVLIGFPLPLLPLQILFLNLVTDVFPAFALGTIGAGRDVLTRDPRSSDEKILGKRQYRSIVAYATCITATTLFALWYALNVLGLPSATATTVSFYTLALAQLWHVFNMRNWRERWITSVVTRSRYVWAAVFLCLSLLAVAASLPIMSDTLQLQAIDSSYWMFIIAFSLVPVLAHEVFTAIKRYRNRTNYIDS